jgi:NADPH:quinone reductase-like Zn-dependent oxidoreductase
MKALVTNKYGLENMTLEEVLKPTPKDNEVQVKVHASCVNQNAYSMVSGNPFLPRLFLGILKPKYKIPGADFAGEVTATGSKIKHFKPTDKVYGTLGDNGFGAYAEYVCAPEKALALKPENLNYEEAAAIPEAALVALQTLRAGQLQKGQKVLIYSASGGIGTFAVQIAKAYGAEVTAVCSGRNLDMVRSIGADYAIDYTKEDFTASGQRYDLILAIRKARPISDIKRALSARGVYVSSGGPSLSRLFQENILGPMISRKNGKRVVGSIFTRINREDLETIKKLAEAGKLKPVIEKIWPLKEAAEALRHYGKGHTRGKIVITVV